MSLGMSEISFLKQGKEKMNETHNADPVAVWEPWSDNLSLEEQVSRLRDVMLAWYPIEPSRAGGVIETAARLLRQAALTDRFSSS